MDIKDISKEKINLIITILLGFFGVHKFIQKEYKMGIIYLFTGGLFGIGWIIDIIKALKDFFEVNKINPEFVSKSETKPERKLICDKYYKVSYTHTEGRQKLIKQLIKEDDFLKDNDYFNNELVGCEVHLDDGEMPSGKECINVTVVRYGKNLSDHVGYIIDAEMKELIKDLEPATTYSPDLYISTEDDGKLSVKVRVKMYVDDKAE